MFTDVGNCYVPVPLVLGLAIVHKFVVDSPRPENSKSGGTPESAPPTDNVTQLLTLVPTSGVRILYLLWGNVFLCSLL